MTIGMRPWLLGVLLASFAASLVAIRFAGFDGPWIWNLDIPKVNYPFAVFFHEALHAGRLPLWNDELGMGFPLYAEGQIGAFYPPNWIFFLAEPIVALDVNRVVHLTFAGVGTGVLAWRASGSAGGAILAAIVAALGGAVASKLEWTNMVAAYAWIPWILLPLLGPDRPTRRHVLVAGIAWGAQALAGHPNVWILTGIASVAAMATRWPPITAVWRAAGFGLLGLGVGAVQILPTALLVRQSVRAGGVSEDDIFTSSSTVFDPLLLPFIGAFAPVRDGSWDLAAAWYPDSPFALLEAAAYVGLPVLMLAAVGLVGRSARPWIVVAGVMVLVGVLAALRPPFWADIPVLNGLRSPVRAYLVASIALAVLAAIGTARLPTAPGRWQIPLAVLAAAVSAHLLVLGLASVAPTLFDGLLIGASTGLGPEAAADRRALAVTALTEPWPLLGEVVIGVGFVAMVAIGVGRPWAPLALVALVALPLVAFAPSMNPQRPIEDFSFAGTPFVRAVSEADPELLLTIDEPGWYAGLPNQLPAAGIRDIRMFSSLNLASNEEALRVARTPPNDGLVRRALGVDLVATFGGAPCPGAVISHVDADDADLCRIPDTLQPPYWIPDAAVVAAGGVSTLDPGDAQLDLRLVIDEAGEVEVAHDGPGELVVDTRQSQDGWLFVDRSWWHAWHATVDGRAVPVSRALGAQIIPVAGGSHRVEVRFLPLDALAGLALGVVGVAVGVLVVRRRSGDEVAAEEEEGQDAQKQHRADEDGITGSA